MHSSSTFVKFDEPSPALTPSWRSSSWNRSANNNGNIDLNGSPDLHKDLDGDATRRADNDLYEAYQREEQQLDRDW